MLGNDVPNGQWSFSNGYLCASNPTYGTYPSCTIVHKAMTNKHAINFGLSYFRL